jgi:hypothetical protein
MLAFNASTPPRPKSLRHSRTVSSRTPNASAICGLLQPDRVSSDAARAAGEDRRQDCPAWAFRDLSGGGGNGVACSFSATPGRYRCAPSVAAGRMLRSAAVIGQPDSQQERCVQMQSCEPSIPLTQRSSIRRQDSSLPGQHPTIAECPDCRLPFLGGSRIGHRSGKCRIKHDT